MTIGPENSYTISDSAINHIINGNISERQDKDSANKTVLTKVIAGGLHTLSAWQTFLVNRPDIKHGLFFDPAKNENWYYCRELQNGVMLLKIPREAFQSKAAKITEFPETYYKSGYLWKTLFPIEYSKDDILIAINEALHNQDKEETEGDLIIGYTKNSDPLKVMKIRIQLRNKEILSAFPTWGQPMTGNNGKPFSHIEAINTVISGSTIYALDEKILIENLRFSWNNKKMESLIRATPKFIIDRKACKVGKARIEQRKKRNDELKEVSSKLTEYEIQDLLNLILTDDYLRYTAMVSIAFYNDSYKIIKNSLKIRNALSLYQNLIEILKVIYYNDLKNNTRKAFDFIKQFLKVRFINTGGIDQWEVKRLSNVIMEIISGYKDKNIALIFFELLIKSPCRIAFFTEFNFNQFFNKEMAIIGINDAYDEPLEQKHFLVYVSENLGINYTLNFTDDFNIGLAKHIQYEIAENSIKLVDDSVRYSVAKDLNMFWSSFCAICDTFPLDENTIKLLDEVIYDYHRCLAASVQRIIAKHKKILSMEFDDYEDFDTPPYNRQVKARHEYQFLSMMMNIMIENLSDLYKKQGFESQAKELEAKYLPLSAEVKKIPMPRFIPEYID